MRLSSTSYFYGVSLLSLSVVAHGKRSAGSGWPSPSEWQSLNSSLGGSLQNLRPWASVCYTLDPFYDPNKCQAVTAGYINDTIREEQPSALLWSNWEACGNGQGCNLDVSNPQPINGTCHQGTTPPYFIPITSAQEASTIVKWAVENGVILTVKSTGHDLLGRSAAPGTLQVNVAQLQNLQYVPQFVAEGSDAAPVSAITAGGGVHAIDIYQLAERENVSVALGSCETLGAGGYFQAGGHGPLSPTLGLGIDTVLEYEIVTADGKIRKANAVQNSDLFWAMRGGGSGSWGIITSVTIQAYPTMQVGSSQLHLQPNPAQNISELTIQFIELYAKYQNGWIDAGVSTGLIPSSTDFTMLFYWPANNDSLPLIYPFFDDVKALSANFTVTSNQTAVPMYSSFSEAEIISIGPLTVEQSVYGAPSQSSSRLVPRSSLTSSESIRQVAEAIWAGHETVANVASTVAGSLGVIPPFISGNLPGGAFASKINDTGANPALYEGSFQVIFAGAWSMVPNATYNEFVSAVAHAIDPLTEMGIVGSYQGEGNAWEVNWQETFFGYKYSKLTKIKSKYDPDNFFNSWKGVNFQSNRTSYQCYGPNLESST